MIQQNNVVRDPFTLPVEAAAQLYWRLELESGYWKDMSLQGRHEG